MRKPLGLLLMLAILLPNRRSGAQSESPALPSPAASVALTATEVVVTGTRTPEQSQRATVKTDVVTRDEAERRGATNVAEALSTQPGVQVNPGAYGYLGTISPIQIQGFDLGRVLILEDGEPVIGDVGGAIDLAAIPVNDLSRIEIVSGPSSALYGSSAIGGVVNILSAPPRQEGASARVRAEYRSHRGAVLQGSGAYRTTNAWSQLDLSHTRQGAITERPGLPDTQIPELSRSLVGARIGGRIQRNIELKLRARWLRQRFAGVESSEYPGLGRYVTDLPKTSDRIALQLVEDVRLGRGATLRLSLARQWAQASSANFRRESPLGQEHVSSQLQQSFEGTATLADGPRTWVIGARVETQRLSQRLHTHERVDGALITNSSSEVTPQALNSAAVYSQLAWAFGRALTLLPGVRGESHGRQGSVIAPRLALAVRPNDAWTLRASAGRGFRTPSAEEFGFNFDHSVYGYKVIGNRALRPEQSWGVNGDVALRAASFITLRAGGFVNWVRDLIEIDLGSGVSTGTVVSYRYANFQRVRTAGGNLGLTLLSGDLFRTDLAYDYLWTRDELSGQPLAGRPPHTLTAASRWSLPWRLELSARARLVSAAFVDATTRTPGYQTVDARVAFSLSSSAQAYAGGLNLLDVHQAPGRVGDLRPPLGRVFYVGLAVGVPQEQGQ